MRNIKLTTTGDRMVFINWDRVDFMKSTANHFGDNYTEVHFAESIIDVKETVEEIEKKIENHHGGHSPE